MEKKIFQDYKALSLEAAGIIVSQIRQKPDSVICLASGETPLQSYALMTDLLRGQQIDYSQATFLGLDEWVGIPPENPGSCHWFLHRNVIVPLQLRKKQYHLFDALSEDIETECAVMDDIIQDKGGIDLIVVGIGMNGHIGFNEPDVSPDLYSHVIDLDEKTQTVGQKYFSEQTVLKQGITIGLKHFMESRTALLLANGTRKADIMRRTLEGEISPEIPATIIRNHRHGIVLMDQAAAADLTIL